jgi:hypothetical protein
MGALTSTLTARFSAPGERPEAALERWRANPPEWLPDRYREIDRSYNSVTWEWRHTPLSMKLTLIGKWVGGQTVYRLTALFADDGHGGSAITVNGACDDRTHEAIRAAAEQVVEGGVV